MEVKGKKKESGERRKRLATRGGRDRGEVRGGSQQWLVTALIAKQSQFGDHVDNRLVVARGRSKEGRVNTGIVCV